MIGVLAGFGAVGFRYLIGLFHLLFYGKSDSVLGAIGNLAWYWRLIIPMGGGLAVGLLARLVAAEVSGSGVPQVMDSVAFHGGRVRTRIVGARALASSICIASGGSAGREGPIIHIGSAIGSAFGRFTKMGRQRMRTLVACGATAGIAATFNAPIAGAFFSLEVILGNFAFASFGPLVISSVAATMISHHWFGDNPAFEEVPKYAIASAYEYPAIFLLGITAGLLSLLFIFIRYRSEDLFDKIRIPVYAKAGAGGLLIGACGLIDPRFLGVGYETVSGLIRDPVTLSIGVCILLFVLKIFGTSLTLGSGGSGGIFAPALFMGAVLGAAWGKLINLAVGVNLPVGPYVLVGMGAFVAGATHAPITSILILFEMTRDYKMVLPLMLACVASAMTARLLKRDSVYTEALSRRGVDITGHEELRLLDSLKVRDHIMRSVTTIPPNMLLRDIYKIMIENELDFVLVTEPDGETVGEIYFRDIKKFLFEEGTENLFIAAELVAEQVPFVYADDTFRAAMQKLVSHEAENLPVLESPDSRKALGVISRQEILNTFNREFLKERTSD